MFACKHFNNMLQYSRKFGFDVDASQSGKYIDNIVNVMTQSFTPNEHRSLWVGLRIRELLQVQRCRLAQGSIILIRQVARY